MKRISSAFCEIQGNVPETLPRSAGYGPETPDRRTAQAVRRHAGRFGIENFARLEKEIEWFTLKFDYRNEDKPWGNSRDAVKRSINKLREQIIE